MEHIDLSVIRKGETWVINTIDDTYHVYWNKDLEKKERVINISDVELLLGYVVLGGQVRYVIKGQKSPNNALVAYKQEDVILNGISIKDKCHRKSTQMPPSDDEIRKHGQEILNLVFGAACPSSQSTEPLDSSLIGRPTDKEITVEARLQQGEFRKKLIKQWAGKCMVTGIDIEPLLRASHIKAYAECTDVEKYDLNNGLLLSANIDALFDRHLITFDVNGNLLASKTLTEKQLSFLGIDNPIQLHLNDEQKHYMNVHRELFYKQEQLLGV